MFIYLFTFFFFYFFYYFILFFNFKILYWFCHISTWIHHRYTRVPHPEPSSFLPPRTIPLEPIIQNEIRQKEKHQYSILTHIYGIYKDGNNNPVYKTAKETLMYSTVFWTLWERKSLGWFGRMALDAWGWCCRCLKMFLFIVVSLQCDSFLGPDILSFVSFASDIALISTQKRHQTKLPVWQRQWFRFKKTGMLTSRKQVTLKWSWTMLAIPVDDADWAGFQLTRAREYLHISKINKWNKVKQLKFHT